MAKKMRITFSVEYETYINCDEDTSVAEMSDLVSDIEIPECHGVNYKKDSFEPLTFQAIDSNGKEGKIQSF